MDTTSIIKFYEGCRSIRETALALEIAPHTVRRVLVLEGIITNPTHAAISKLAVQGLSKSEIAARLHVSISTVNNYLPYRKGRYKSDAPTANALRIRAAKQRAKQNIQRVCIVCGAEIIPTGKRGRPPQKCHKCNAVKTHKEHKTYDLQ